MIDSTDSLILETVVSEPQRLQFLPRHFGTHMMTLEHSAAAQLGQLSEDYQGGYWDFFDLSNGGCYMAPTHPKEFNIRVEGNGYCGRLDAKGAGIVTSLFCFSHLSFRYRDFERFAERFHQLREFALERHDASEIFAAID